jgi:hypothetical protein
MAAVLRHRPHGGVGLDAEHRIPAVEEETRQDAGAGADVRDGMMGREVQGVPHQGDHLARIRWACALVFFGTCGETLGRIHQTTYSESPSFIRRKTNATGFQPSTAST